MFRILLNEQTIGESEFETGDPPMGCVSGALKTKSSVDNLLKFILNNGGISKDGEYSLELDSRFSVVDVQGKKLEYLGGCIMAYPDISEILIDIVGIPYPEYGELFPKHVSQYESKFST